MPLSVIKTNSLDSSSVTAVKIADNTITTAKLAQDPTPTGTIGYFGYTSAPTGWLKANGAAISRTTYATLFASIGTTFGSGNGSTTFNIPDLRGYFPRGWDDGAGVDSGRAIGSSQADDFKSHQHFISGFGNGSDLNGGPLADSGVRPAVYTSSAAGGTETRPKNIALLACIKF